MNRYTTEARTATGRDLFKDKKKKKAKEVPSDIPTAIQLGEHGRYQIKSGRLSGEFVARAFPKPPTNARGLIAEARGASEEEAIAALHDVIDARETRRTEGRRIDETMGVSVPSIEEYLEALDQITLSRPQHAMLTALALSEDDGLSEQRMANAAGYKSRSSANRAFAAAGLLIASYLAIEMPAEEQPENLAGSSVLGLRGVPKKDDAPGNWILFRELREALRSFA
jgi:sirohydrochlorin ferrochelatase